MQPCKFQAYYWLIKGQACTRRSPWIGSCNSVGRERCCPYAIGEKTIEIPISEAES